jgi:hypothetical protein
VQPRLVLNGIGDRAPLLEGILAPRHTLRSVRQQSHIALDEEQFARALEQLEDAYDPSLGDRFEPGPFFRSRLS